MALIKETTFGGLRQSVVHIRFLMVSFEVTFASLMITLLISAFSFYTFGDWYVLIGIPIFAFCVLVERKEPRAFHLIFLWLQTIRNSAPRATLYFGGSTRAPLTHRKGPKRRVFNL